MGVPYYQFVMDASLGTRNLKILRDASGDPAKARYAWADLTFAWHADLEPPLEAAVIEPGLWVDVSFASGMVPLLSARAAGILGPLVGSEIQLIPAKVEGEKNDYFVMNILSVVKCLDEQKTQFIRKWTKDSPRPDREGEYRSLSGIAIDPAQAAGHNLFRLWGHKVIMIASAAVKEAFDREGLTGIEFRDVCTPKPTLKEALATKSKMREFYEKLLSPIVEAYGPVQTTRGGIVGFDGGGPVNMCVLRPQANGSLFAYVTCELAVRKEQKPAAVGRFELMTVCDDEKWASAALSRVARTSLAAVLGAGHTVDLGPMPHLPGTLAGVLVEAFTKKRIEGEDYGIYRCIGITRAELDFARDHGVEKLLLKLREADAYASTKVRRESVV